MKTATKPSASGARLSSSSAYLGRRLVTCRVVTDPRNAPVQSNNMGSFQSQVVDIRNMDNGDEARKYWRTVRGLYSVQDRAEDTTARETEPWKGNWHAPRAFAWTLIALASGPVPVQVYDFPNWEKHRRPLRKLVRLLTIPQ